MIVPDRFTPHRHLIADHLGWFDSDDLTQGGKYPTIEALLKAKGENVTRGSTSDENGILETTESDAPIEMARNVES